MVYVFTGDGKGKTSAALGVAMRAVGNGMKVAMVQWYKEASWRISEHELANVSKNFDIYPMGKGFYIPNGKTAPLTTGQIVVDKTTHNEHIAAALAAYKKAVDLCDQVDVLVCDEILNAASEDLLDEMNVLELIWHRKKTHLILTGRNASKLIIDNADLVTEMKKIKHPYDVGKLAVKGLDF